MSADVWSLLLDGAVRLGALRTRAEEDCRRRGLKLAICRPDSLYQCTVIFEDRPASYWSVVGRIHPPERSVEALSVALASALDDWIREHRPG